ncbi:MAG: AMP-binding protein, partial [Dongiaceae bacterium]
MAAKKARPRSRKSAVTKAASKRPAKAKVAKKSAPRPAPKARPKEKSGPRAPSTLAAKPKRAAPQLAVQRAEAPDRKAMLEQALSGTPQEGQRVAEKAAGWAEAHARSLADPAGFWSEAAAGLDWIKPWDAVLDDSNPPYYRWFKGGVLNTCYNALDRHVETGRGEQAALIYDSPVTNTVRIYSYQRLRDDVARFAGALTAAGVGKGDRVIIYMPMVPEALIAMLACARISAVHSVVFGGFAAAELATRINDATPKAIVSASCGVEVNRVIPYKPLLDAAIAMAIHKPERCIILQRPMERAELIPDRDIDWQEGVAQAEPQDCVPVQATDPLYILYTSGTTGQPKGIVRDHGGHAVALHWTMRNIYGMAPGEVYWAASDVGWVVGHSYIVYAPLLAGNTTVLYEGKPVGTPDAGAFWRVVAEHKVAALFTAPTAFRAIKKEDPEGKLIKDYD